MCFVHDLDYESLETDSEARFTVSIACHCCSLNSAGAGRTGTFLAIDYLLEEARLEKYVDVPGCVRLLREERPRMVPNLVTSHMRTSVVNAKVSFIRYTTMYSVS